MYCHLRNGTNNNKIQQQFKMSKVRHQPIHLRTLCTAT
jgi:hypothetical protein